jgi:hypothetical protein
MNKLKKNHYKLQAIQTCFYKFSQAIAQMCLSPSSKKRVYEQLTINNKSWGGSSIIVLGWEKYHKLGKGTPSNSPHDIVTGSQQYN